MTSFEETASIINSYLETEKIKRVIYVDDSFDKEFLDRMKALCFQLSEDFYRNIELDFTGDQDIDKEILSDYYSELDPDKKSDFEKDFFSNIPSTDLEDSDFPASSILTHLIDNEKLKTYGVQDWLDNKAAEMDLSKNIKTLFLFDQELGNGITGIAQGKELAERVKKRALFGIITHITDIENQIEKRNELATNHEISPDSFFVASKKSLTVSPILFPHMLRLTLISPAYSKFKEKIAPILNKANKASVEKVKKLDIESFDYLFQQVTKQEGLWEPEMLLRIYHLFHYTETLNRFYDVANVFKISNDKINELGDNSGINPSPNLWQLQKYERYLESEVLNQNALPIEIGDIFKDKNEKLYILLNQPCDIALRSNGKRANEKYLRFVLIQISKIEVDDHAKRVELEYYGNRDERYVLKWQQILYINPLPLDLCALNDQGVSEWSEDQSPNSKLRDSWKNRQKHIGKQLKKIINRAAKLHEIIEAKEPNLSKTNKKWINNKLFECFPFSMAFDQEKQTVSFGVQRIKRLKKEHALDLLKQLSHHQNRTAFDVPFVEN